WFPWQSGASSPGQGAAQATTVRPALSECTGCPPNVTHLTPQTAKTTGPASCDRSTRLRGLIWFECAARIPHVAALQPGSPPGASLGHEPSAGAEAHDPTGICSPWDRSRSLSYSLARETIHKLAGAADSGRSARLLWRSGPHGLAPPRRLP